MQEYQNQIENLFSNYKSGAFKDIVDRGYLVSKYTKDKDLLFIGLNPSFRKRDKQKLEKNYFFDPAELSSDSYFKGFYNLVRNTQFEKNWTFIDLLFIRHTEQKFVKEIYKKEKDFICRQLEISKKMIQDIQPKIIIVCDTFARTLIEEEKIFSTTFDEKTGTHRIGNDDYLKNTIVFFSGMLIGVRALDKGSSERLQWHIKQIEL